jgi:glycosyltransferase involved in cell wall biosynthesis
MAIKMLLESPLNEAYELVHLSTNVRKSNADKGQFGPALVAAFFKYVIRLVGALVRQRPDVVYSFVTATRMGWLGRDVWTIALSRMFGAKVVIHMRGGHFRHRLKAASRAEIALVRWACRRAHKCLVQGPSLRNQFEGLARPEAIAVVPNMIDVERYSAVPPGECEPGRILFLGHLTVAKGYCEVLKVIPEIIGEFPIALFEFAGTRIAKERNVLHVQTTGTPLPMDDPQICWDENIKGRFEEHCRHLGMLDEDAKMAALRRCDFMVLPSFSEGFSMAVLEAMAMGKPVVTTAVGAMRDYVRDGINGRVIEPGDTAALAAAIRRLLGDRGFRDRIAARNARQVREQFSQSVIGEQLGNVFEELLCSRHRQMGAGTDHHVER